MLLRDLPVLGRGLQVARLVDGPRGDAVLPGGRVRPVLVPELPGELVLLASVEGGGGEGPVVDLDLHACDGGAPGRAVDAVKAVLQGDLRRDGLEARLAHLRPHPDAASFPRLFPDCDVFRRHEGAQKAAVPYFNARQPLHVGDPVPAGGDEPERIAVALGQGRAVHLVAEQVARIHGLRDRHAAGEVHLHLDVAHVVAEAADVGGRLLPGVGPVEDDVDAVLGDPRRLEHGGQGGAGPSRVPEPALEPVEAAVARALEGEHHLLAGEGLQLVQGVTPRPADTAGDLEPKVLGVDIHGPVVGHREEALVRGDPRVEALPVEEVREVDGRGGRRVEEGNRGLALASPGEERRLEEGEDGERAATPDEGLTARHRQRARGHGMTPFAKSWADGIGAGGRVQGVTGSGLGL